VNCGGPNFGSMQDGRDGVLKYNIAKQGIYIELENYQFLKEKIARL